MQLRYIDRANSARVVFGIYLFIHFVQLVPWGKEMFSNQGTLPDRAASPLIGLFPNVLAVWDSPVFVTFLIGLAAVASASFALGFYDRAASMILWYVHACLFGRNPLIANPALPYVGAILLSHACIPRSYDAERRRILWILMAAGYSFSGYTKLISMSWIDGTAVEHILQNPLARPSVLRDSLLLLPQPFLHTLTWGFLALECLFAPLAVFPSLRPWLWTAMLGLHLSLMVLIDFTDLSAGMVMLHMFTFDSAWLRRGYLLTGWPGNTALGNRLSFSGYSG